MANTAQIEKSRQRLSGAPSWPRRIWLLLRSPLIVAISVVLVYIVASRGVNYAIDQYFSPPAPDDHAPVAVSIGTGTSVNGIAKALYDNGIIRNRAIFKIYVDFMGKGQRLRAGNYVLTKAMTMDDVIDRLIAGAGERKTIPRFPIPEGTTVEQMAALFKEKGLLADTKRFLELCETGDAFTANHGFLNDVPAEDRKYKLEGYLYPDSYDFYADSTEEVVIDKLLSQFFNVFTDDYTERAQELGMTMDEIVTLATLVEKEARPNDFARVSAVFHNRLEEGMMLQSDVTIHYASGINRLYLTNADTSVDSPYNTYKYAGLPAGPICNPGRAAIQAALYPDEAFIEEEYLYFCLKDPDPEKGGELAFAKTLKEHEENVAQYQQLWRDYDAKVAAGNE